MNTRTSKGTSVRTGMSVCLSLAMIVSIAGAGFFASETVYAEESRTPLQPVAVATAELELTETETAGTSAAMTEAAVPETEAAVPEAEPLEATAVIQRMPNNYLNDYFGFTRTDLVQYMVEHANDLLGTPYQQISAGTPIPGKYGAMDCQGFVWTVLIGVAAQNRDRVPFGSVNTVPANGGGWIDWAYGHGVDPLTFSSKEEMLASGVLEKGDIIWSFDAGGPYALSSDNHVGIFWGDSPTEDKFWHSARATGDLIYAGEDGANRITPIESMSSNPSVWWVFKLSKDHHFRTAIWEGRPENDIPEEEAMDMPMPENEETVRVDIAEP